MSRCEAMVAINGATKQVYVMCGKEGADLHHKLTKARGGLILDEAGETYHQLYLCRQHHNVAHDEDTAYEAGLLIRGYVVTNQDGRPLYTGPDEYLSLMYGMATHQGVS